ncbi:hypothetical protein [Roseibium sp. RKSG952]|nr:hypothetical protein [Roseibium sp. RKSG952]
MTKLTKETLFKPSRAENKHAKTETISKQIIDAETEARRTKR